MPGHDWTSEYYEILEFYYWEPQHLGRSRSSRARYENPEQALAHVQNMEVSLNHMFNIFFRLAPDEVIHELMTESLGCEDLEPKRLLTRRDISEFCQLVQPDLTFQSVDTNFSIEMKLKAKSSLEQVWKYALLHYLADTHDGNTRSSYLLYLGKSRFRGLWRQPISDIEDLVQAALTEDIRELRAKVKEAENVAVDWNLVRQVLEQTRIGYWTYVDLAAFLNNTLGSDRSTSGPAQSFMKLTTGLADELGRRRLT